MLRLFQASICSYRVVYSAALALGMFTVPARAATFTTDFLAAETEGDTSGKFGPWAVGGYNNAAGSPGVFTAYGAAQHLTNWGSFLPESTPDLPTPATDGDGPFTSGEFKGYGYNTATAIPAITINTTAANLSPCCGISPYAPGQVFVHSGNAAFDPDPARQAQVVRYTTGMGLLDVSAQFTQKHTGAIPLAVYRDGVALDTTTLNTQDQVHNFSQTGLVVNASEKLDFVIAGRASAAFNASVTFRKMANVNAAFLANERVNGSESNPAGVPNSYGYNYGYSYDTSTPASFSTTGLAHTDNYAGSANLEGYIVPNNASVPAILQNTSTAPITTSFDVTLNPGELLLHPGNTGADAFPAPRADAVVRYTVPTTGTYNIAGSFRSLSTGTTESKLVVNGATLANVGDAGYVSRYGIQLTAGATIDFTVGSAGDIGADSTGLTAVILPTNGARFSTDFITHEMSGGTNGTFGRWTVGGYNTADASAAAPAFTGYTPAQHLENWGSILPAGAGDGPFTSGEFQGFGYDSGLSVPAVTINTTDNWLGPCCGISEYAPGQVFVHAYNASVDPARQMQVIRYTAETAGTANFDAFFTVMHTGNVIFAVRVNGDAPIYLTNSNVQNATFATSGSEFLLPGEYIDFIIGGSASASFDALVNFTPVPEPSSLFMLSLGAVAMLSHRRKESRHAQ